MCVIHIYVTKHHHGLIVHHHHHAAAPVCAQPAGGGTIWGASYTPGHSSLLGYGPAVTAAGITTVPEIPPWLMLILGVGLLIGVKRRRSK